MPEISTSAPIERTYATLKDVLLENKCRITDEKPPEYILIEHGSLRGIMPKSAKKTIAFHLSSESSGTKITASSNIAKDWQNLTIYGNILAAAVAGIFLWIAADMNSHIESGKPGFWAWLAQVYSSLDVGYAFFMINVTRALAVVLFLTIVFEILIVVYVYPRKDAFAQQILDEIEERLQF